jgi:hypothetical protein
MINKERDHTDIPSDGVEGSESIYAASQKIEKVGREEETSDIKMNVEHETWLNETWLKDSNHILSLLKKTALEKNHSEIDRISADIKTIRSEATSSEKLAHNFTEKQSSPLVEKIHDTLNIITRLLDENKRNALTYKQEQLANPTINTKLMSEAIHNSYLLSELAGFLKNIGLYFGVLFKDQRPIPLREGAPSGTEARYEPVVYKEIQAAMVYPKEAGDKNDSGQFNWEQISNVLAENVDNPEAQFFFESLYRVHRLFEVAHRIGQDMDDRTQILLESIKKDMNFNSQEISKIQESDDYLYGEIVAGLVRTTLYNFKILQFHLERKKLLGETIGATASRSEEEQLEKLLTITQHSYDLLSALSMHFMAYRENEAVAQIRLGDVTDRRHNTQRDSSVPQDEQDKLARILPTGVIISVEHPGDYVVDDYTKRAQSPARIVLNR